MAYTTNQALETLNRYLGITDDEKQIIENTKRRGFVFSLPNGEKAAVFVYPLVHKQDNTKNYFDTRDSGAYERGVAIKMCLLLLEEHQNIMVRLLEKLNAIVQG